MKRLYRHLWIIQEMIWVINKKTEINFLLSKTFPFFPEQKYIFSYSWKSSVYNSSEFNCLGIFFPETGTKIIDMSRHC